MSSYRSVPVIRLSSLILPLLLVICAACTAPPEAATPTATATREPISPPTPTRTPAPSSFQTGTSTEPPTRVPSPTPGPQSGEPSIGDPYAAELGNTGYDVQHYHVELEINPGVAFLRGTTTITAAAELHNLIEFSLDFAGFEIQELLLDGAETAYRREGGKIFVEVPEGLAARREFVLLVRYEGSPQQVGSPFVPFFNHLGFQFLGQSAFTYNQPDGAHFWFPCNDHPRDKAAFTFDLSVPTGMVAVANGVLANVEEVQNRTVYRWENAQPMATYLVLAAVGDYERIDSASPGGIPLQHYVFEDLRPAFNDASDVTGEALDWMAEMFGEYPFDAFGFVTTRLIRASLETQGMVLLNEDMLNEETVIHEIAHMWFGNWVTMASWADMWHNEGFAIYLSLMWQTRENPGGLNIFMQNLEAEVGREASAEPLGNLDPHRLFGFDSYQRGALMIHYLRLEVGDEAFFEALRVYFERFGGGVAAREDFIAVFEEVGGLDLDDFFSRWLETLDYP